MKPTALILIALPALAAAQAPPGMPPGYFCTHYNDYYIGGTPPPGQPNECEAVGSHATDNSFTYFFPLDQGANNPPPVQSVPEVGTHDAFAGIALVVGLMAIARGRRKT